MRLTAAYHKGRDVAFTSHLDVQRTLQRAFRRAEIPLAYSNGFNPHPQLSFATAAATGMSSECEWFDIQLYEPMQPEEFTARANAFLPEGFFVSDAFVAPDGFGTLASKLRGASYTVEVYFDREMDQRLLSETLESMLGGEIIVNKRTKSGIKPADLRPQILSVFVEKVEDGKAVLRVLGRLQADGGLRVELLIDALAARLDAHATSRIHREGMFFAEDGFLPRLPAE